MKHVQKCNVVLKIYAIIGKTNYCMQNNPKIKKHIFYTS